MRDINGSTCKIDSLILSHCLRFLWNTHWLTNWLSRRLCINSWLKHAYDALSNGNFSLKENEMKICGSDDLAHTHTHSANGSEWSWCVVSVNRHYVYGLRHPPSAYSTVVLLMLHILPGFFPLSSAFDVFLFFLRFAFIEIEMPFDLTHCDSWNSNE